METTFAYPSAAAFNLKWLSQNPEPRTGYIYTLDHAHLDTLPA